MIDTAVKLKGRVLLFYPNSEGYGGIPNGMALLSGHLKESGFETKCFDSTFLNSAPTTHFYRSQHGGFKNADHSEAWGGYQPGSEKRVPELLLKTIQDFQPDLIAVSILDANFMYAVKMLAEIKKHHDTPVVAGGPTVTLAPEWVSKYDCIDYICVGEGEGAIVELANAIVDKTDVKKIANLGYRENGGMVKNELRKFKDMDKLAYQDWEIFDERHYYKPYMGKFRRTGFFELARGCHFNCTYCCTANLRQTYKGLGNFMRYREVDKTFEEIIHMKDKYGLELIFFIDDDFLGMPKDRLEYFCEQFKSRINLPFYIQTRSETVREPYVKMLKDAGISTMGIGVESGDEEFRKQMLGRGMNDDNLQKAFDIINGFDIRSTANVIIGMPGETEDMFVKTIKLIKRLKPASTSINYFQPYLGTKMRQMAIDAGYISPDYIINDSNLCLDMPKFKKDRIIHYYTNFSKYLEGRLVERGM